ncbi:hypothetical protein GGI05_002200, partial [Coemansia sp. RSA 2603]
DQAIVLSGVNGSGKSETAKLICDQLCVLASNSGHHSTHAQYQMAYVGAVVEAFASAATAESQGATRAGIWQEVQFNERSHILGAKLVAFGLDRWRVTDPRSTGKSNFNVFSYLVHGSTSSERQQWQLRHGETQSFAYLAQLQQQQRAVDDLAHTAQMMDQLRAALKVCGVGSRQQAHVLQVLSAILHLGNVRFGDAPDCSKDAAVVHSPEEVDVCAQLLGVTSAALTAALSYKTALVGGDLCTVFLNAHGAHAQRDALARVLYHVLFYWLVDQINRNISDAEATNHIAVLQMYGFSLPSASSSPASFEQFAINLANERFNSFVLREVLGSDTGVACVMHDNAVGLPHVPAWSDRLQPMHQLTSDYVGCISGGLEIAFKMHAASEQALDDIALINCINCDHGQHPSFVPGPPPSAAHLQTPQFGIRHWMSAAPIQYSVEEFCHRNMDLEASPDLYTLLSGTSRSCFVCHLFRIEQIVLDYHPEEESSILPAKLPSVNATDPANTFIGEISGALDDVFAAADRCKVWHVLHVCASPACAGQQSSVVDSVFVQRQVHVLGLSDMVLHCTPTEFTVSMLLDTFAHCYMPVVDVSGDQLASVIVDHIAHTNGWAMGQHYMLGTNNMFMTEHIWRSIETPLHVYEKQRALAHRHSRGDAGMLNALAQGDDNGELVPPQNMFNFGDNTNVASTAYGSKAESASNFDPEADDFFLHDGADGDSDDDHKGDGRHDHSDNDSDGMSAVARNEKDTYNWAHGNLDSDYGCRQQVVAAEREGLVEEIDIMPACFVLFFIIGLGLLMCPKQYIYNMNEVAVHTERSDAYVALHGHVYDITNFLNQEHGKSHGGASPEDMIMDSGQEVNASFPLALHAACPDLVPARDDPNWLMYLELDIDTETALMFVHHAGSLAKSKETMCQDFYHCNLLPKMRYFKVGDIVWDPKWINSMHHCSGQYWCIFNGEIFNLNLYFAMCDTPENVNQKKWHFLQKLVESIFKDAGACDTDVTKYWCMLPLSKMVYATNYHCLKTLFYNGKVDTRQSFRCLFPNFLLLAAACLLMLVILIKFLASLQLSSRESSLCHTIDSLATLGYDEKHRLLFIICDGNVVGSGNDQPTPQIVLDILGVDPKLDPPLRSFRSIGEGGQQHNMAKVYSGLYEYEGHVVPYLVVAKIGKPTEKSRPGNRGKRDSQMLLMHFLNRVHFEAPMSPLDLEIYHQMKNVIGVHPSLYEYLLMVDADTEVVPDSLTRLVACMVHDAKVIGICGETQLTNEDFSWTTMIQVYEYFISHHMAKAFESLFGSVTCLPGCFCMYRLCTACRMPLIISKNVVKDYSENHVDTLHKKNLLSLGEDRYLTTLMMKYFPQYKMTFTADAKCKRTAPDT